MRLFCLIVVMSSWASLEAQEPRQASDDDIRRLIEGIGSAEIADRDKSAERLKSLGARAVPLLRKCKESSDNEVAARAEDLLRWIEIDTLLPSSIKRTVPTATDRLSHSPADGEWSRVLTEALAARYRVPMEGHEPGEREHLILKDRLLSELDASAAGKDDRSPKLGDFGPLAWRALREANQPQETALYCRLAGICGTRDAVPELRRRLQDRNASIRAEAAGALGRLRSEADKDALIALLKDSDASVRQQSTQGLRRLKAKEACLAIRPLLADRDAAVRLEALQFALEVGKEDLFSEIVGLVDDPVIGTMLHSREAWEPLGGKELLPRLAALESSDSAALRRAAAKVIKLLEKPSPGPGH